MGAFHCNPDAAKPSANGFDPARRDVPLLIYDGDCGFCDWWVRYWQQLNAERVRFAPGRELALPYQPGPPQRPPLPPCLPAPAGIMGRRRCCASPLPLPLRDAG